MNETLQASLPSSTDVGTELPVAREAKSLRDYELLARIASGGMGVVYKARQISLNRVVALKMILAGQFAKPDEVRRFLTEAEAAAHLNHPNIVSIYEVGQHEGQHFFSMQFIEGASLDEEVDGGRWKLDDGRRAAQLMTKVARAVEAAHQKGVIHRDLKPGNILLDGEGEPHVADFGLARRTSSDSSLTLEGSLIGTPSFMAPEQAAGKVSEVTTTSDIYSLGAILYYLLTGRPPFAAESLMDTLAQVLAGEVVLPRSVNARVPRELEQICLRCLEKAPQRRYPTAGALAEDLEKCLRGEPVAVRPAGVVAQFRHWARQQPALVSRLLGLALCAGIAHGAYLNLEYVTLRHHVQALSVLGLWAAASALCQWGMRFQRWAGPVRIAWAAADAIFLTAELHITEAVNGPLPALYPVLIAMSGLWFRPALVALTTVLAALGYGFLLACAYQKGVPIDYSHRHILYLVGLGITGFVVAYLVNRIRVLTRFYERPPKS
jgi:eukaryotic-like serine/threonine-protein kinase